MFCCTLLYVHSSFAIILTAKREVVALLCLSSWCLVIAALLFLTMPWVCLQFVIVVLLITLTYYFCLVMKFKEMNHSYKTLRFKLDVEAVFKTWLFLNVLVSL